MQAIQLRNRSEYHANRVREQVQTSDFPSTKLLYGMLLDRMSLSARNDWYDSDTWRVYIYYTVEEICEDMTCGRDKAMKLLAELDTKKGVGLIERIKQGQGKPTKIYVKRFTTRTVPADPAPPPQEPFAPISQVDFSNVQKSEIPTPRGGKNRRAAVENPTLIILRESRQSLSMLPFSFPFVVTTV